jgi:hypothetical protein
LQCESTAASIPPPRPRSCASSIKTWYEHMLEIERRRLTLAGHGAAELNTLMKRVEEFYSGYLLDRLPLSTIARTVRR